MLFSKNQFENLKKILNRCNNQVWYDTLKNFMCDYDKFEIELFKWIPSNVNKVVEIEEYLFNWIKFPTTMRQELYKLSKLNVKYVFEMELYFATPLEDSFVDIKNILDSMENNRSSILKDQNFIEKREKIEDRLEYEIVNKGLPSTITAINVILNGTDKKVENGSYHSSKEIINTWTEYFVINYAETNDYERELLIEAFRLKYLEKVFKNVTVIL